VASSGTREDSGDRATGRCVGEDGAWSRGHWRRMSVPAFLAINGGSSSIRFVLYRTDGPLEGELYGQVDRIGLSGTSLTFNDPVKNRQGGCNAVPDHTSAAHFLRKRPTSVPRTP
ncbi:MAG: hypothetical protein ABI877_20700, partial [Gemmatimonadaceae bacterium]